MIKCNSIYTELGNQAKNVALHPLIQIWRLLAQNNQKVQMLKFR